MLAAYEKNLIQDALETVRRWCSGGGKFVLEAKEQLAQRSGDHRTWLTPWR
jgi:hypothetical protein